MHFPQQLKYFPEEINVQQKFFPVIGKYFHLPGIDNLYKKLTDLRILQATQRYILFPSRTSGRARTEGGGPSLLDRREALLRPSQIGKIFFSKQDDIGIKLLSRKNKKYSLKREVLYLL